MSVRWHGSAPPSGISVMETISTLLPGTRIMTFSFLPNSLVRSFSRRETLRHCTIPPAGGFLETLMLRLCFICDRPFRKAICFLLPFGVPRKGEGLVRVSVDKTSKIFSGRLRWIRKPTGNWHSPVQRSPGGFYRLHTDEGGVAGFP